MLGFLKAAFAREVEWGGAAAAFSQNLFGTAGACLGGVAGAAIGGLAPAVVTAWEKTVDTACPLLIEGYIPAPESCDSRSLAERTVTSLSVGAEVGAEQGKYWVGGAAYCAAGAVGVTAALVTDVAKAGASFLSWCFSRPEAESKG